MIHIYNTSIRGIKKLKYNYGVVSYIRIVKILGGLLDISTARYFYKVSKTILHKPTANSGTNIFYNKCSYKHYLQLFIIYLIL